MKLRLQTSITVLLVGLILATVTALGLSSYYYNRKSADELRARIVEDTSQSIYGEIGRLLQMARQQAACDRDRIQSGALSPDDFPALVQSWLRPMQTHPELAFLALSMDNGNTVRIGRSAEGQLHVQEWRLDPRTKNLNLRVFLARDYPQGAPVFAPPGKPYDIQQYPWFRAARNAGPGQQVWTESYSLLGEQGYPGVPGTACVTPAYGKDRKRVALLVAGIDVLALCAYLKTLHVGQQGFAFVAELENDRPVAVIAHHPADAVWRTVTSGPTPGEREPVPTSVIADLRVRAFMGRLPATIHRSESAGFVPLEFAEGDTDYVGGYQYLKGSDTPEWIICIVMPEREIMGNVWRNNLWMLGGAAVTMLMAGLAGLYVARQIAHPLEQLVQETREISQFNVGARPMVCSHVREVAELAVAVEEMKTGLRSFRKYVPVDLVRALMQTKQEARVGGATATLTVFFSDIVGFTQVAEAMNPGELVEQLSEYLGAMNAVIGAEGGTVDKFIGDAVMAFWGAPEPNPQHALAACTAALRCQATLHDLCRKWKSANQPLFKVRIGLNTGKVVVGNIGSETRLNYTAVGDAVNLASRLESLNKQYGTDIIISESTLAAAEGGVVTRQLDHVVVKGKTQPVAVHELLGLPGHPDHAIIQASRRYEEALTSYRQREWQRGIELLSEALRIRPADGPSQRLLALCRDFQAKPPGENWNGISRLSEK